VGWSSIGYPGYFDSGFYDDSEDFEPPAAPQAVYPDSGYSGPGYGDYPPPPVNQADAAPASAFRPAYQSPQPDPATQEPVTLVFKDGRPTEQIHNFMLTRTTLYVQDSAQYQRLREIPLSELDLAATEKINHQAGVDFQPPAGTN
jgi:hypothetical protein